MFQPQQKLTHLRTKASLKRARLPFELPAFSLPMSNEICTDTLTVFFIPPPTCSDKPVRFLNVSLEIDAEQSSRKASRSAGKHAFIPHYKAEGEQEVCGLNELVMDDGINTGRTDSKGVSHSSRLKGGHVIVPPAVSPSPPHASSPSPSAACRDAWWPP